jgi:hypothetical protein
MDQHDYIFFFGDLNYRVWNVTDEEVRNALDTQDFSHLLRSDQLRQTMMVSDAFRGFFEPRIMFPPTYKFKIGDDEYDTARHIPSWTDRVLYHILPLKGSRASDCPPSDVLDDAASARSGESRSFLSCVSQTPPLSPHHGQRQVALPGGLGGTTTTTSLLGDALRGDRIRRVETSPVGLDIARERGVASPRALPTPGECVANVVEAYAYSSYPLSISDHRPVSCAVGVSVVAINTAELRRVITSIDLSSVVELTEERECYSQNKRKSN